MKRTGRHIALFLLAFCVLSCAKKKYPESVVEDQPVYYSKFDVDGKTVEIKADAGYYMYTDKETDSLNVQVFTGHLRPLNCGNCGPAFKIGIRDSRVNSKPGSAPPDSAISKKAYHYLSPYSGDSFMAEFAGEFNKTAADGAFVWDFGDGESGTGRNPVHTYKKAGNYKVCLTVKGQDSCRSTICNTQRIQPESFSAEISAISDTSSLFHFIASVNGGTPPYFYSWDFGDLSVSNQPDPYHKFKYTGSYGVKLKVTDSKGQSLLASYNAVTKKDLSSCAANYQRTNLSRIPGLNATLSKVLIIYTDEKGVTFRSDLKDQPANSQFVVTGLHEGERNERGQATKTATIQFNCEVYNGDRKHIITNGVSVIGVSYQ